MTGLVTLLVVHLLYVNTTLAQEKVEILMIPFSSSEKALAKTQYKGVQEAMDW